MHQLYRPTHTTQQIAYWMSFIFDVGRNPYFGTKTGYVVVEISNVIDLKYDIPKASLVLPIALIFDRTDT